MCCWFDLAHFRNFLVNVFDVEVSVFCSLLLLLEEKVSDYIFCCSLLLLLLEEKVSDCIVEAKESACESLGMGSFAPTGCRFCRECLRWRDGFPIRTAAKYASETFEVSASLSREDSGKRSPAVEVAMTAGHGTGASWSEVW